jgi:hypothetical protein
LWYKTDFQEEKGDVLKISRRKSAHPGHLAEETGKTISLPQPVRRQSETGIFDRTKMASKQEETEIAVSAQEATKIAMFNEEVTKASASFKQEKEELSIIMDRVSFRNRFLKDNEDRYVKLFREYTEASRSKERRRESTCSDKGTRSGHVEVGEEGTNGLNSWYDNLREGDNRALFSLFSVRLLSLLVAAKKAFCWHNFD